MITITIAVGCVVRGHLVRIKDAFVRELNIRWHISQVKVSSANITGGNDCDVRK